MNFETGYQVTLQLKRNVRTGEAAIPRLDNAGTFSGSTCTTLLAGYTTPPNLLLY
jgi:hypothetical protein